MVVARDSQQALDYLCCRGIFEKRIKENPAVILLDLKLRYGPSRHIASRHQPGRSGSWHAASFAEHDARDLSRLSRAHSKFTFFEGHARTSSVLVAARLI